MDNNQMIVNPTTDELKKAKCYTQLAILNSTKAHAYGCFDL